MLQRECLVLPACCWCGCCAVDFWPMFVTCFWAGLPPVQDVVAQLEAHVKRLADEARCAWAWAFSGGMLWPELLLARSS